MSHNVNNHFVSGWKQNLSMLTNLQLRKLRELIDEDLAEREEFL
jgi:hypothetical protein